jgi:glycolate oxidase iron-sulfur subunit
LGFEVSIPPTTCCCGALHRHSGFIAEADQALAHSAAHYDNTDFTAVVALASACCGELRRHPGLKRRVVELSRFVADQPWPLDWALPPVQQRLAVHVPCSQRYALQDPGAATALLGRIPGLELVERPDQGACCGAAGLYTLRQPELSQRLLDAGLAWLTNTGATGLVTTNIGCALQWAAGIRSAGLAMPVRHPVELLADRLPDSGAPLP